MQYTNAYDVRTKEEWELLDIKVRKSRPIYIISPIKDTKLVNTKTGEEFVNEDLNPLEVKLAIKNNLISKSVGVSDFEIIPAFDIVQTDCKANSEAIEIDRQTLLNILYTVTSCQIEFGTELVRDYKNNRLIIPKQLKYDRIASEVVRYIVNYDINNNIKCNDMYNKKLLALIERKKLETLLGCESQDIVHSNAQVYDIINFLDIADTIVNKVLDMLSNSNTFIKLNYEYDIKNNIRAKKLVNIMSASYISNKLSN